MFAVNKVQGAGGQDSTMDADADLSGAPETFLQNKMKRFEKWDILVKQAKKIWKVRWIQILALY